MINLGAFCNAKRDGDKTWLDFSFTAPWRATARDHGQFVVDMRASLACNFKRGLAPFAWFPKLALAPYFKWSMVMCDWMHATTLVSQAAAAQQD